MLIPIATSLAPDEVARIAKEACTNSGMRVRVTGSAPIRDSERVAFDEDHTRIVFTACILIFILAMIIFRGLSATLVVSSGPLLGLVWTWGLLRLFGQSGGGLERILVPVMIL
ncbi:MAG: MMPL family transporter, partial [Planctomycetota bacterium]|jgi:predicted RND superfamily exporter protein